MSNIFKKNDSKNAIDAQYAAQKIAFAPIIFQVAKSMRDLGILKILQNNNKAGLTIEELLEKTNLSKYAIKVLLETSLSADIVKVLDDKYFITRTGYFLANDQMTKINMNYNHYVNYLGLYHLEECLKEEKPIGLQKVFGNYETIYPVLSSLSQEVKQSWFEFDHFYSDSAFPEAVKIISDMEPKRVLDIGGNTGKFSIQLAQKTSDIQVTIVDLPEQIKLANENILPNKLESRIDFFPMDILDETKELPKNYDVIWMSQFLDCFKQADIVSILKKVKKSMGDHSKICIMEPLWDKQKFETSAYCIINTSPYFAAIANGYSKILSYKDLAEYIHEAGLEIKEEIHNIGLCQSIIICY